MIVAPIRLAREAQLVRRRGGPGAAFVGPGGYRRRVERLRAVEHCSKVLLARMFSTLPDAFRYFIALGDGPSFFLSDFQLETCFVTVQQLRKGLHQLLLEAVPPPAPLSPSRRIASRAAAQGRHAANNGASSSAASWSVDVEDILEEITLGFLSQLSLLDFLRVFEWDPGLGAETQLEIAANRRHLEYQVRMEIREKKIVAKWKFLSLAVRARVVYWRWMYLMATFAWNDWRAFTKASLDMKRKGTLAAAHARLVLLRRTINYWRANVLQSHGQRGQVLLAALPPHRRRDPTIEPLSYARALGMPALRAGKLSCCRQIGPHERLAAVSEWRRQGVTFCNRCGCRLCCCQPLMSQRSCSSPATPFRVCEVTCALASCLPPWTYALPLLCPNLRSSLPLLPPPLCFHACPSCALFRNPRVLSFLRRECMCGRGPRRGLLHFTPPQTC